jgi:cell division protein YceG involved in septum cleavage
MTIDNIARFVIKPWYENLIKAINKDFDDFIKTSKVINISTFIVVICCVVLLYCLVWKSYEENLKDLLKTSVDLINLIPEEIKHQIVQKLNEEENKND